MADDLGPHNDRRVDPITRLFDGATITENGCWESKYKSNKDGYIQIKVSPVLLYAHRLVFEWAVRPLTENETVDHTCRNRRCMNPSHLDGCTHVENILRGTSPGAVNARKDSCIHGHPFTEANIYRRASRPHMRECKTCRKEAYERTRL